MVLFAAYLAGIRVYDDVAGRKRGTFTPIVVEFMYKRRVAEVLLDLALVAIAYYAAYRLRFEGPDFAQQFPAFYQSLPIVVGLQVAALFVAGIYRGVWRYFGLMDAVAIAKGVFLGSVGAQLAILYLFRFEGYSKTVFIIYAILLAGLLGASRASFRLIGEFLHRNRHAAQRIVIYGAGDGGSLVVRELMSKAQAARYKIVGFVDDDARKQRVRVQGYPVLGGYAALAALIISGAVDAVVISTRIIDVDRLHDLEALCGEHGVSLARLNVGLDLLNIGDSDALASEINLRKSAS
jgi:UDP-GlcNAc:undecaprenyl-phosphate GlcNAc-1-phosphate transferase